MIYPIDRLAGNIIPQMKNALISAGILTTVHFENATDLIVTTTRSNKVIRFSTFAQLQFGSAWTSGVNLTNVQTTNAGSWASPVDWAIIVTPDILAYTYKQNADIISVVFTKTADDAKFIVLGFSQGFPTFSYDTTIKDSIGPEIFCVASYNNATCKDSTGVFYYSFDMYFEYVTNSILMSTSPLKGVKSVINGANTAQGYYKHGNDVVMQGFSTSGNSGTKSEHGANLLIANGVV